MNDLESGLYLPIRFYQYQTEQDRFKRQSLGVALTELNYPYVDCTSLAPFQISAATNSDAYAVTVQFNAFCADTNEMIPLAYNSLHWEEYLGSDGSYYLSYLGSDDFTGDLSNGLYYLGVVIISIDFTLYFYSDLFMIANCGATSYETEEFRTYSEKVAQSGDLLRSIDPTDLRIIK